MQVVKRMPIEYDEKELERVLQDEKLRGRKEEIVSLIKESHGLIEPKAVYTYLEVVEIVGDNVRLENGDTLKSIVLADMLRCGQRVAPYVVTIGQMLENQVSKLGKDNVLLAWALDKIGNHALGMATRNIKTLVEGTLGGKVSSFGPGTGTGKLFEIEQQAVLFQILQPPKNIGVRLTPTYLMVPRKSISGVFAVTDEEYVACQYCPRKCEFRRSAFRGEYHPRRTAH